ncbi:MAG: uridine kinase [Clostridia bacterium]|nr:uridine kinase [Clostridia bacterium]
MLLIGICGASGSGKTTLAEELCKRLNGRALIISQDWYYRDRPDLSFSERKGLNYDEPGIFDHEALYRDITDLAAGKAVPLRGYDYTLHLRKDTGVFLPARDVVLAEGIHIFYDEALRSLMDLKIYMEVPADVCALRRVRRDITERGRDVDGIQEQYLKTVRPMYMRYIRSYADYADLMVGQDCTNPRLLDMLIQYITARL